MNRVQKIALTLFFIFSVQSCANNDVFDLEEYVKKIDNLDVSEIIYLIETDSTYSFMDTIALRKVKYYPFQKLVFERNIQLRNKIETSNYYDSTAGLIYSIVKFDNRTFSEFKTVVKDGLITSAEYLTFGEDGTLLKTEMAYSYTLEQGKKRKLIIDSGNEHFTYEYYNFLEKPTVNFTISNKDTVEKSNFYYNDNGVLQKKVYTHFGREEQIVYYYKEGKYIVNETYLENNLLDKVYQYTKDKNGNFLRYTAHL